VKKAFASASVALVVAAALGAGSFVSRTRADDHDREHRFEFKPNTLVVSRSVYAGDTNTVQVGQTLPPGCMPGTVAVPLLAGGTTNVTVKCATATADGTYPTVFANNTADGSFGITSPIFLDNLTTDGERIGSLIVPSSEIVTSFSSKSELALNLSDDRKSIAFVGYRAGPGFLTAPNQLDVSNSNTPGVVDPTNPVTSQYYRAVAEVDAQGHLQVTDGNAYSGNNGRAAAKANWTYYLVGNDNNGGLSSSQLTTTQVGVNLITSTGAELLIPGQTAPASKRQQDRRVRDYAGWLQKGRQGGQRQQLSRPNHIQQHDVCDQGKRRQRHQHRLSSRKRRHSAFRQHRRPRKSSHHDPSGISHVTRKRRRPEW